MMNNEYDRYYQDAIANSLANEFDAAVRSLRYCQKLQPDRVEPLLDLLLLYHQQGMDREVMVTVEALLDGWPHDTVVRLAIARVLLEQQRKTEAMALLDGIFVAPGSLEYPNYLELLLDCELYEQAFEEASKGMNSPFWAEHAQLYTAIALSKLMQHEEALALFEKMGNGDFGIADQPLRQGLIPAWIDALFNAKRREQALALLTPEVRRALDAEKINLRIDDSGR